MTPAISRLVYLITGVKNDLTIESKNMPSIYYVGVDLYEEDDDEDEWTVIVKLYARDSIEAHNVAATYAQNSINADSMDFVYVNETEIISPVKEDDVDFDITKIIRYPTFTIDRGRVIVKYNDYIDYNHDKF